MRTMRVRPWLLVLSLGLVLGCGEGRELPSGQLEKVEKGVEQYARALDTEDTDARLAAFRSAERLFASAAAQGGASPDLYVNLGNAALGGRQLGEAVLAFRRALALDPDHPRALQNLEYARSLLPLWVPRRTSVTAFDSFFFWHRTLSRGERGALAAWSFLAASLLVALGLRLGQALPRHLAWIPGAAWLALSISLLADPVSRSRAEAVVTAPETSARAADSALAPLLFTEPLPGGVEAELLERRGPWARIRLYNGREVWVTAASLTRVASDGPLAEGAAG